mmetsp:Transcript_44577/g.100618  ORF Transcript_44577/g.100618 Transcript_44577/m.100618 type:complete len:236 (+) Transcript_44577:1325-2032(+)
MTTAAAATAVRSRCYRCHGRGRRRRLRSHMQAVNNRPQASAPVDRTSLPHPNNYHRSLPIATDYRRLPQAPPPKLLPTGLSRCGPDLYLEVVVGDALEEGTRRLGIAAFIMEGTRDCGGDERARFCRDSTWVGRERRGACDGRRCGGVAAVGDRNSCESHQAAIPTVLTARVEGRRDGPFRFHAVERARDVAAKAHRAAPLAFAECIVEPAKPPAPEAHTTVGAVERASREEAVR